MKEKMFSPFLSPFFRRPSTKATQVILCCMMGKLSHGWEIHKFTSQSRCSHRNYKTLQRCMQMCQCVFERDRKMREYQGIHITHICRTIIIVSNGVRGARFISFQLSTQEEFVGLIGINLYMVQQTFLLIGMLCVHVFPPGESQRDKVYTGTEVKCI